MPDPPLPRLRVLPYVVSIVMGGFLLFQVQPLIAAYILPWFGGTPAIWTTCMLFFQTLLIGGYAYAGFSAGLKTRTATWIHVVVLGGSLLLLPITPSARWIPTDSSAPLLHIFGLLLVTVGIPYFVLSTTGPLIQHWFARDFEGRSPYRLFAVSNGASLLGLVTYPFIARPLLRLDTQTWVWSALFVVYVFAVGAVAIRGLRRGRDDTPAPETETESESESESGAPPTARQRWMWFGLAAIASALFLAVTEDISLKIGPAPFLWVIPLALYLVTFIVAFDHERWFKPLPTLITFIIAGILESDLMDYLYKAPTRVGLAISFLVVLSGCMLCHGELSRLKPHSRYLTNYYLIISLGGAAGGLSVAVLAPLVGSGYWELPLSLAGVLLLAGRAMWKTEGSPLFAGKPGWAWGLIAGAFWLIFLGNSFVSARLQLSETFVRNFYGSIRVGNEEIAGREWRVMRHGAINHGAQFLDEPEAPTTYFSPESGIGVLMQYHPKRVAHQPLRVAVVGLGAGALCTWARAGDYFRFYEINPASIELAKSEFTFISDARERGATVDLLAVDGRIGLVNDSKTDLAGSFDVVVLDAFSGAAPPAHLLTVESIAIYEQMLRPDGVLAFNITNRHLDFTRVLAAGADARGLSRYFYLNALNEPKGWEASNWILMSHDTDVMEAPGMDHSQYDWPPGKPLLWTDQKLSIVRALR